VVFRGLVVGVSAFAVVGVVVVGLFVGSVRQVRLLQGLFLALAGIGTTAALTGGESVSSALFRGVFIGGLSFLPLVTVLSVVIVLYWVVSRHSDSVSPLS
jgi:hypothetical protein